MGVAAGKGRSQDVDLFQLKPLIFKSGNPYKTKFSIENKRKTFSILNVGDTPPEGKLILLRSLESVDKNRKGNQT